MIEMVMGLAPSQVILASTWMVDHLPTSKPSWCITNTKVNSAFYLGYV